MAKIDPRLRYLCWRELADEQSLVAPQKRVKARPRVAPRAKARGRSRGDARTREGARASSEQVNVMVQIERDGIPRGLRELGFIKRTTAGNVLTGNVRADVVAQLEKVSGLKRAEQSRILRRELDVACVEARADLVHNGSPARRGVGVIVGIIDRGIDYQHQSFRKPDGTSRIIAIWDQGLTPQVRTEVSPAGFGYGVEYEKKAIDAALRSTNPGQRVRHADHAPFHGTHVAGIAAGNGQPSVSASGTRFVGVAPEAELIVVANTRGQRSDPGTLGDSADTLDAVQYILKMAKRRRRPVVINLSEGDNIGPHDGSSLLEVGIANLMKGPGRALVKSAGNGGDTDHHATGTLAAGDVQNVQFEVPPGESEVMVDIWYGRGDRLSLQVAPPDPGAASTRTFEPPSHQSVTLSNGNTLFVDADVNDPGNRQNRTFVLLEAGSGTEVQPGIWSFQLRGQGRWHAWIQVTSHAVFKEPFVSADTTISIPASSTAVISVGAYISNALFSLGVEGELADVSSRGPTRDGRLAPTLSAPGVEITAPQPGDRFAAVGGTSMSAAMVSGAVALMFEKRPRSTASKIKEVLEQTARRDAQTGKKPNDAWGAGKLDIAAAVRKI